MHPARPGKLLATLVFLVAAVVVCPVALADGHKPAQINVGYFKHWPAPVHFAQANKTFEKLLGLRVNWLPYRSDREMSAALAAGELQIAWSLGQVPLLVAINAGADLAVVGIAVSYPEGDGCILRDGTGIDRSSASALAGKTVALRPGSLSHFRMLKVLNHLGVDSSTLTILPLADGDAMLQALQRGAAVMACGNGNTLRRLSALGKPLMSGAEQDALGLKLYDVVAVSTAFMEQQAELLQAFMEVAEAANRQWRANPQAMLRLMARVADMDRDSASDSLRGFHFPLAAEQKSDAWLGERVPAEAGELAGFFVAHGQLEQSADSYDRFFTTRFLR